MNNDNNSKYVKNNITECDVDTTVIIVDDTNKIDDPKTKRKSKRESSG